MGLTERLAAAARVATRRVGSLDLISSKDVGAFLRAAEDHGVIILGIEGFHLNEGCVILNSDAIADFSGIPHDSDLAAATIEEARHFLLRVSQGEMFFDFAIEEAEDKR